MGHPRRLRKKYSTPAHPYRKERIEEEAKLTHEYGLKNNTEIWKARSAIRKLRAQARKIQADKSPKRAEREKELMDKLKRMGLVAEGGLDEVLALTVNNWLDRRLQTFVFKKGLAKTHKQARQFITHGHITVNDRKVNIPSYSIKVSEESRIGYYGEAPLIEETPSPEKAAREVETKPKVPEAHAREVETKPKVPEPHGGEQK